MNFTIKTGFAVLVASLILLSPLSACAAMFQASAPAHDCCPAPAKNDCAKTICVCAATETTTFVLQPVLETGEVAVASSANFAPPPFREGTETILNALAFAGERYVSLHQFRI